MSSRRIVRRYSRRLIVVALRLLWQALLAYVRPGVASPGWAASELQALKALGTLRETRESR